MQASQWESDYCILHKFLFADMGHAFSTVQYSMRHSSETCRYVRTSSSTTEHTMTSVMAACSKKSSCTRRTRNIASIHVGYHNLCTKTVLQSFQRSVLVIAGSIILAGSEFWYAMKQLARQHPAPSMLRASIQRVSGFTRSQGKICRVAIILLTAS